MNYDVVWQAVAEDELAAIWLAASDRDAVAGAALWFDDHLSGTPLTLGESRDASVNRITFHPPIGIVFEVVEDDKRVIVQGVFQVD